MSLVDIAPEPEQPESDESGPNTVQEDLIQFLYRAPIGLVQMRLDGAVEMANPMAAQILMPLSPSGDLDNLFDVLESVAPGLRELTASFAPDRGAICESLRHATGNDANARGPQFISISLLKLEPDNVMAVLMDATMEVQRERRGIARRLDAAARVDSLTKMPNRAGMLVQIHKAMERSAIDPRFEFAVVFLNCDRFKQINDALGHAAGDEVLSLMADRLRSSTRQRNRSGGESNDGQRAARIGGDEFAVVLDDLEHPNDVHMIGQRLLDVLGQPYAVGSRQLQVSISMGIVLQAEANGNADAALQDASIAMVEAKRAGGGRYTIFEPAMHDRAVRRSAVEADLRRALADHHLYVVYQPVVGLQSHGSVDRHVGVEALVRWRHPTRGVVPPLDFIGVAEESGLIGAVGSFVLNAACHQFGRWQEELGVRAPRLLAVNLSRGQLKVPGFVEGVAQALSSSGVHPSQLQLEVTESLAAQDESIQAQLHALKRLGLTLALDDFGTGYSSLSSLHQLPVDTVKIDRSFVSQAATSTHHQVLIEATIRVAESLSMGTVAEGIETPEQCQLLKRLGCQKGQGYLFSQPLLPEDLVQWLTA